MVFFVTTLLLIGYGLNIVLFSRQAIVSDKAEQRKWAILSVFVCILAAIGVIYLAAH